MNPPNVWDAIVVGAGPAGALATFLLARRGLQVLLLERSVLPRAKVCGGCLNERGLSVLAACGLENVASQAAATPLSEIAFTQERRTVTLRGAWGAAVNRARLDAALANAARAAGAVVLDGTLATVLPEPTSEGRRVALRRRGKCVAVVETRIVVAADGLGHPSLAKLPEFCSRVAADSRVGLGVVADLRDSSDWDAYPAGRLQMTVGTAGYMGVTRLSDGRLCIGAAVDCRVAQRGGAAGWMAALLAENHLPPIHGLAAAALKGTLRLTRRTPRVAGNRVFVVGDAAGYDEPITGEGMTWALAGAAALAPIAAQAARSWNDSFERRWAGALRAAVFRRAVVNRALAASLRRPRWSRWLFAAASVCPAALTPVVRYINQPMKYDRSAA